VVIKLWRVTEELIFRKIWRKTRENVEKLFVAAKIMENIIGEIGANFVESLKASRPLVGFR
jgi:hypothetical protein